MIRRPPRSTQSRSSAASDVYKRQVELRADVLPAGGHQDGPAGIEDEEADGAGGDEAVAHALQAVEIDQVGQSVLSGPHASFPHVVSSPSALSPSESVCVLSACSTRRKP